MKVLVIDDSDLARSEMVRVLRAAGHDVSETASPIGATRLILAQGIEVVVLDVNLPSMRGDKLMQLFRSNPRLASLRVVLISGMPPEELQRIAKECAADAAVEKRDIHLRLGEVVSKVGGHRPRRSAPGDSQAVA